MNALLSYRATLAAVFLLVNAVGYSATTDKDFNLQAGVGDSPCIKLMSADSQQLVLQKLDFGDAVLTTTDGKLCLQPNGDTDDYLCFESLTDLPTIYWEGVANNAPGIRISATGQLEYRDEDTTTWVSFDSLDNVGSLTFADGDLLDLSPINGDSSTEGLLLPQSTDTSASTAVGQISWDIDDNALYVGDGTTVVAIGVGSLDLSYNEGSVVAVDLGSVTLTGTLAALPTLDVSNSADGGALSVSNTGAGNSFLVADEASDATPFVIDAAGNVGIATSVPLYTLDITGTTRSIDLILPQDTDVTAKTALGQISWDTDDNALYVGDGTTVVAIGGGGGSLDVSYDLGSSIAVDLGSVTLTGALAALPTLDVSNSADGGALSVSNTGAGNSFLVADEASDTTPFVIDTAGNVGIGEATPSYTLDVAGTTRSTDLILPQGTDVTAKSAEGQISWDADNDALYVGDGTSVVAIGGGLTTVGDGTGLTAFTGDNDGNALIFEGTTDNAFDTTLVAADTTTSNKTLTLPDITGTLITDQDQGTVVENMLAPTLAFDAGDLLNLSAINDNNTIAGLILPQANDVSGSTAEGQISWDADNDALYVGDGTTVVAIGVGSLDLSYNEGSVVAVDTGSVTLTGTLAALPTLDVSNSADGGALSVSSSGSGDVLSVSSSGSGDALSVSGNGTGNALKVTNTGNGNSFLVADEASDTTPFVIDTAGNVGIGEATPSYTLDVAGTTRSTDLILPQGTDVTAKSALGQISWDTENDALYVGDGTTVVAIGVGGLDDSYNVDSVVAVDTGSVTLTGTLATLPTLDVSNSADGGALSVSNTGAGNSFLVADEASDTTPFVIDTAGNVGIGEATPSYTLDVAGTTRSTDLILPQGTDVTAKSAEGQISWDADNDALYVGDGTSVVAIGGGLTTVGDGTGLTAFTGDNDGNALIFEGTTDNAFDTTLVAADTTTSNKTLTLPDITGTLITNQDQGTVVENMLAPTLAFDAGDLLNLSAINDNNTIAGLILPQANDVSGSTAEGQISWDADNDALYVGDGTTVVAIGVGSLDLSYNEGSVVAVDTGSVTLTGTLAVLPTLDVSNSADGGALSVSNTGAGNSFLVADEASDTTPFVIDAAGNVGIANNAPSYTLDVAGTTRSTDLILPQDSNANVLLKTAEGQISWDTDDNVLYVGDGTNVVAIGVGGLDDSYNVDSVVAVDTGSVTLTGTLAVLPTLDVSNSADGGALSVSNTGAGNSFLVADEASDTTPFVIDATGNVGIATSVPLYTLDVAGTTRSTDLILPQGTDVTAKSAEGQISWDADNDALYVGDGTSVVAIGGGLTTVGDGTGLTAFTGDNDGNALIFEGITDNAFDTTLVAADTTTSNKTLTLPDITGTLITNQDQGTVVENMLAPTLAFDAGDLLNLSAINDNSTTAGLILPQANDVSNSTAEGQISWDADNDALYVGDGTTVVAIGVGSLDLSYNEGSVVAVDTGSVTLTGTLAVLPTLDVSNSADGNALSVSSTGTGDALKISNTGAGHSFLVEDTALDATPFVIDTAGNVGIGEATPSYTLDVAGTTRSTDLILPQGTDVTAKTALGQISWDTENDALYVGDGTTVVAIGGGLTTVGDGTGLTAFTGDNDGNALIFEGTTDNALDTTLVAADTTTSNKTLTLPDITGTLITDQDQGTVVENMLAPTLAFDAGDLLNLSAINDNNTTAGLILPQANDVSNSTAEGQISWDADNDALYVGDGTTVVAIGVVAPVSLDFSYDGGSLIAVDTSSIVLTGTLAGAPTLDVSNSSNGGGLIIRNTGAGHSLIVIDETSDTTPFVIDATGNVGIANSAPLYTLDVAGTTRSTDLILPQDTNTNVLLKTAVGQISWDTDNDRLYVGNGGGVGGVGSVLLSTTEVRGGNFVDVDLTGIETLFVTALFVGSGIDSMIYHTLTIARNSNNNAYIEPEHFSAFGGFVSERNAFKVNVDWGTGRVTLSKIGYFSSDTTTFTPRDNNDAYKLVRISGI